MLRMHRESELEEDYRALLSMVTLCSNQDHGCAVCLEGCVGRGVGRVENVMLI